ncbi:MAG TPA: DUF5677 domain-containing protein [Thermoanaerobaculia bacterium]|nr:DUF5677 domain-containing protein [Thermoanaerobaculia bacterium]
MNAKALPDIGRFYAALKSSHEYDNTEVLPKVKAIDSPTERQHCFIAGYYRALATVRSLLRLDDPSHFQAIASLARTLFELAIDLRLIGLVDGAIRKIYAFAELERLRSAEKMVAFGKGFGATEDLSVYKAFIADKKGSIEQACQTFWPNLKLKTLKHWSLLSVAQQAEAAGSLFAEMYHVNYKPLSWQVHSGLAGVMNLEKDAFPMMCGIALKIAVDCYADVLDATIVEFNFGAADRRLRQKLQLAVMLPFTDSEREAVALQKELLS